MKVVTVAWQLTKIIKPGEPATPIIISSETNNLDDIHTVHLFNTDIVQRTYICLLYPSAGTLAAASVSATHCKETVHALIL
jgi:hypothetical protein